MSDEVTITRDYSDNFSMKDYAFNILAPKYFPDIEISDLNIGLTGLTMEQISNFTEDTFRTVSVLINEAYPNRAQIPENIYTHAALFQIDTNFASCAKCTFILALPESNVLENAVEHGDYKSYMIDANTVVDVDGIRYTLDYDINIKVQTIEGQNVYSAQYEIDYTNSISDISNRYIRIIRTASGYLNLQVIMHQVEREIYDTNIVDNKKINFSVIEQMFSNQLAGFDVLYKSPSDTTYTQLKKQLMFTSPVKVPFCYYRFKDANPVTSKPNTISISFSTKDSYFQPEFNSDIRIIMYTTTGSAGNFSTYTGDKVTVTTTGDKYPYNSQCMMIALPVGSSVGGGDAGDLEDLREQTINAYSSATVLSTENDLKNYFTSYARKYGNEILFIKKRDDFERLFSSFIIMKDSDYIYPTNTLGISMTSDQSDIQDETTNEMILKPGHLFRYKAGTVGEVEIIPDKMVYDEDLEVTDEFVYTNPFLIKIRRKPNVVGFYMNSISDEFLTNYDSSNSDSFVQFICSKLLVNRTLSADSSFHLKVEIAPTVSNLKAEEVLPSIGSTEGNKVRVIAAIYENESVTSYIEMIPTAIESSGSYTFEVNLETNDQITSTNKFKCLNATPISSGLDYAYIPATDCTVQIYTLFYNEDLYSGDPLFKNDEYINYIVTNVYSTASDPVTFVRPMSMMRSVVSFERSSAEDPYQISLTSIPFIRYDIARDKDRFDYFINSLTAQYTAMENEEVLQNSSHIDIKFYNTYGKSKNFYIGDSYDSIDRVNLSIAFKVKIVNTDDVNTAIRDLKILIKNYIETLNTSGTNELYISNLIKEIENTMPEVHHLKFLGINDYSTDYQTITTKAVDINELSKDERRDYVPEMLVVNLDDIKISTYD